MTAIGDDNEPVADLATWCDANELLLVRFENQKRAREKATQKGKRR